MALIQVGRDRKKLVALIQVSEILKITHIYIYQQLYMLFGFRYTLWWHQT